MVAKIIGNEEGEVAKFFIRGLFVFAISVAPLSAFAENIASGSVIEHAGEQGDLIVSRDGVVYWLSVGDDLYEGDVLRSQSTKIATIMYNGCVMNLPEDEDVTLEEEFCAVIAPEEPSMAKLASTTSDQVNSVSEVLQGSSPLIVGGVVLSAGGLVAATNGGDSGTSSAASVAAGAAQGAVDP